MAGRRRVRGDIGARRGDDPEHGPRSADGRRSQRGGHRLLRAPPRATGTGDDPLLRHALLLPQSRWAALLPPGEHAHRATARSVRAPEDHRNEAARSAASIRGERRHVHGLRRGPATASRARERGDRAAADRRGDAAQGPRGDGHGRAGGLHDDRLGGHRGDARPRSPSRGHRRHVRRRGRSGAT